MGLYRRGKVWWMSFMYEGRQYRKSCQTTDKKLAEKIYHKVMTELVEGRYFERLPGERKTFREMMKKYEIITSKSAAMEIWPTKSRLD